MRTSYVSAGFLSIALALTWFIGTQSLMAAPQQQPAAAASQSTTMQGGTATGASQVSPSQTAPPTSTTPGTTPGAAPPPAQADDNPLNLTEDQKAKLRPILLDERQQMEAIRNDASMTTEQKITKAQQIRDTTSPKIKAILTPEQLQKLSDMQKARQQQNQSAPAPSTPPHQ